MPIITMTTDFGTRDGYVGAMKGRIYSLCPHAQIADICHDIPPHDVRQASWCLARAVPEFPTDTVHVAVVDPGVGSARRALVVQTKDQWLVGPDNGIFTRLIKADPQADVRIIHPETTWWKTHNSFDGLALFAPVAAHIAAGLIPTKFSDPCNNPVLLDDPPVVEQENAIEGEVVAFDRFGNAITQIPGSRIEQKFGRHVVAYFGGQAIPVRHCYSDVPSGSAIAIINSDNLLELALSERSLQQSTGIKLGDKIEVRPQ